MAKIQETIYVCDNSECGRKFLHKDDVLEITDLKNGAGETLIANSMLCHHCFLDFVYEKRDLLDPIMELADSLETKMEDKEERGEEYPFEDDEDFE